MSTKSTSSSTAKTTFLQELSASFPADQLFTHQPIAEFVATGFGGVAEYLLVAKTTADLIEAVKVASRYKVPYVLIGSGSGTLFSDVGYPGLVIINKTENLVFSADKSQVTADSGVLTGTVVNAMASRGLGGIEFLAAVPGTVGGAVATGASWGGKSIRTFLRELVVFVPEQEGKVITLGANELPSDRTSPLFKVTGKSNPIILTIKLQVAQLTQSEILRRLRLVRTRRQLPGKLKQFGHTFTPLLSELPLSKEDRQKLITREIQPDKQDLDLLNVRPERVNPQELRRYLESVTDTLSRAGYTVGIRLGFAGYWPDEGNNDTPTTNS